MMRSKAQMAMMMALAASSSGDYTILPNIPRWPRTLPLEGLLRVSCPTCKAETGQPCNRGTLGKRDYHLTRKQAAKDVK